MKKNFDAVKFQQDVRKQLSEKYNSNREEFMRELIAKYGYLKGKKGRKSPRAINKVKTALNK